MAFKISGIKMQKFIAVVLAAVMLLLCVSCGTEKTDNNSMASLCLTELS